MHGGTLERDQFRGGAPPSDRDAQKEMLQLRMEFGEHAVQLSSGSGGSSSPAGHRHRGPCSRWPRSTLSGERQPGGDSTSNFRLCAAGAFCQIGVCQSLDDRRAPSNFGPILGPAPQPRLYTVKS